MLLYSPPFRSPYKKQGIEHYAKQSHCLGSPLSDSTANEVSRGRTVPGAEHVLRAPV